jgi:CMP-2-keto-3-deoxyoctulosonic acid synthetase
VNVQGDEPFIDPNLIEELVHSFEDDQVSMASAMSKIENIKDLQDPNVVKVVVDSQNNSIYFSRAPILFREIIKKLFTQMKNLKNIIFLGTSVFMAIGKIS